MIDVSVITVTHQSKEFIADQILSVSLAAVHVRYEQFVVDNASTDGTAEWIEKGYSHYVHLIKNPDNRGFAKANNQALELAKGRYLLFLNPDMRLELGALDKLIPWMDAHPQVGVAGCKLLDRDELPNEILQPFRFPSGMKSLGSLMKVLPDSIFHYHSFDAETEQEVDCVRGAFMLVRREVIERLGWAFDPRFFLLFEDVDLCQEVRKMGYQVYYTPIASCIDFFSRSFLHYSRIWFYFQLSRGLWVYAKKWYSRNERLLLLPAILIGFFVRLPGWIVKWKSSFCKRTRPSL